MNQTWKPPSLRLTAWSWAAYLPCRPWSIGKRSRGWTAWAKCWGKGPFLKGAHYFPIAMSRMWNTVIPDLYANTAILEVLTSFERVLRNSMYKWFFPTLTFLPQPLNLCSTSNKGPNWDSHRVDRLACWYLWSIIWSIPMAQESPPLSTRHTETKHRRA